jgi:hypothetical protein
MANSSQYTLPIHSKYIKPIIPASIAWWNEIDRYRHRSFLRRNLREVLEHHAVQIQRRKSKTNRNPDAKSTNNRRSDAKTASGHNRPAVPSTNEVDNTNPDFNLSKAELPMVETVSKDTLLYKTTMDSDFEAPARRSVRHLTQRIVDDDESELTLAPVSIRKKINFSHNRPEEQDRPRKRLKTDGVKREKCHCSLTIWDNRQGDKEGLLPLVTTHMSCMATWCLIEDNGYIVDLDMDKPFVIKASTLKVDIIRKGESLRGIGDKYYTEIKIWPSRAAAEWPPIPLLGKSDGDANRQNKIIHTVVGGSLVAKYHGLPRSPEPDTPVMLFYFDESGAMLRTKYALELAGDWAASTVPLEPSPLRHDLDWAVDDSDNFFGRKKRVRTNSSPKNPPPRKKRTQKRTPAKIDQPIIEYYWEPDPEHGDAVEKAPYTTALEGLICPACPTYKAENLWELRFHFLIMHPRFNFWLSTENHDSDTGALQGAYFKVAATSAPQRRAEAKEHLKDFYFEAPSSPFDIAAYLNGDTSWTGSNASPRPHSSKSRTNHPASSSSSRAHAANSRTNPANIPNFVPDPLIALRASHGGHLPPHLVPEFRTSSRPKHPVIKLIRHHDSKTQTYESISHRLTYTHEDPQSETDDERDAEWSIQRHLENLAVDAETYGRDDVRQELFRRWDRHRLEERLDHVEFISESLVRFVRRHGAWLRRGGDGLKAAWGRLVGNLLADRLVDYEVVAGVHAMIWRDGDVEMGNDDDTSPSNTVKKDQGMTQTAIGEDVDPATALQQYRAHVLATPPEHCGKCKAGIETLHRQGVRCLQKSCKTPGVWFHRTCARAKGAGREWVCMGCRTQAWLLEGEIGKTKGKGKGKGKEKVH